MSSSFKTGLKTYCTNFGILAKSWSCCTVRQMELNNRKFGDRNLRRHQNSRMAERPCRILGTWLCDMGFLKSKWYKYILVSVLRNPADMYYCLSICLSVYIAVYLSVCQSVSLSIYLSIYLSKFKKSQKWTEKFTFNRLKSYTFIYHLNWIYSIFGNYNYNTKLQ